MKEWTVTTWADLGDSPGRLGEGIGARLACLGHRMIRHRLLAQCIPPEHRRLFAGWKWHVVDWKWGYMEDTFRRLSRCISDFFDAFDAAKLSNGEMGQNRIKFQTIEKAKQNRGEIEATTEVCNIFASSCGHVSMWMRACTCHWHLWRTSKTTRSLRRKLKHLIGSTKCPWEGKRASELARGAATELRSSRCSRFLPGCPSPAGVPGGG